jgi:hypothetical protein
MKTANELKYLSERYGWQTGPLTLAQVQRMTSDEYQYQSLFNKTELEKALASNQKAKPTAPSTDEQKEFVAKLFNDYPQLVKNAGNAAALDAYLSAMPNPSFTFADFREAFEKQAVAGRLVLNPSACEAGPETEVGGHRLKTHPNLWKLLDPYTAKNPVASMSAAEYKKSNPEVFGEAGLPPMIAKRFDQANATLLANHPEYLRTDKNSEAVMKYIKKWEVLPTIQNLESAYAAAYQAGELETNQKAVVAGSVTKMIDFGAERSKGVAARSNKSSFQSKIDSMTSVELKEKIATDPSFREALDGLG